MDVLVAWLDDTRAGDLASIAGLFIALVGFAITIWNVRASRAAALRAEQAALDARRAIGFFDAITELSAAVSALEEVRRLHRDRAWPMLPDRYIALMKLLNSVRHSSPSLSAQQDAKIQAAIGYLAELEAVVEHALQRRQRLDGVPEWNQLAAHHIVELHTLLLELKVQAGSS